MFFSSLENFQQLMEEIAVPQYFICPISLQIMKDPVATVTGITYDRESIEQWFLVAKDTKCPITKQPLPRDHLALTPNHTLRRLIQSWCTANKTNGFDRIPGPKGPTNETHIRKLVLELGHGDLCFDSLKKLEILAMENERNREYMVEAGVAKEIILLIIECYKKGTTAGLVEAHKILRLIWNSTPDMNFLVKENHDLIDSLTWVLQFENPDKMLVKSLGVQVLKTVISVASSSLIESLNLNFFLTITRLLREKICESATKSALIILIEVSPWGRNRAKMVEAGAVFELIELELEKKPNKKITELIFNLLVQLCSCADGRAELLHHAGSIAMVSKRILRVSAATDDGALHLLSLISKYSATRGVLVEMLKVGAVSKLCMVMQADSDSYLKEIARDIVRLHSNVWINSPCIAVYLLTRDPR